MAYRLLLQGMPRGAVVVRDAAAGDEMNARCHKTSGAEPGFSLPELLTVLALMSIFIVFGGPAMADGFRAYKVRAAADNLTTDIRALRYNAVTNHAASTMTINNQSNSTAPNTYTSSTR